MEADKDRDGKISFEEFTKMVESTDVNMTMTLGMLLDRSVHFMPLVSFSPEMHDANDFNMLTREKINSKLLLTEESFARLHLIVLTPTMFYFILWRSVI
jgi:hypothetical protein